MTVRGMELELLGHAQRTTTTPTRPAGTSAQERATYAAVRTVVRHGALWTALLMVLPGLLSSDPVGNALTGAALGLTLTAVAALGTYAWRSYLGPYRHVRSLIQRDQG